MSDASGATVRTSRLRRMDRLLSLLGEQGSVTVTDVARELNVSTASIRRDLELLENQRLLVRTHGGAVAHGVTYELPLRYRAGRQHEQKRRIAVEAVSRLPAGRATVGLSGGTTTTEVALALRERTDLTVVTNALNIASELVVRPRIRLVVTGGVARAESYELCGPLAEAALEELNLDMAIIGVDGISPGAGLTTHHDVEAHTNQVMIKRAGHVVVVADSSKIGRVAFARIAAVGDVHELITDSAADPAEVRALEASGLTVTVVAP